MTEGDEDKQWKLYDTNWGTGIATFLEQFIKEFNQFLNDPYSQPHQSRGNEKPVEVSLEKKTPMLPPAPPEDDLELLESETLKTESKMLINELSDIDEFLGSSKVKKSKKEYNLAIKQLIHSSPELQELVKDAMKDLQPAKKEKCRCEACQCFIETSRPDLF